MTDDGRRESAREELRVAGQIVDTIGSRLG